MRAVWLLLCCVLCAAPAYAQTDPKALLDEANTHFRKGEFKEAADGFQELQDHLGDEGWFLHYNLGLAYENLGVPTKAAKHYQAFVDLAATRAGDDASLNERVENAKARRTSIEERFGPLEDAPEPGPKATPPPPPPAVPAPTAPPPQPTPRPDSHTASDFPTAAVATLSALALASIALPIALNVYTHGLREDAATLGTSHPDYAAARDDFGAARTGYYLSFALPAVLAAAAITVGVIHAASDTEVATDGRGLWLRGRF